jgi:ABC-type Fe3+ transport system permease subunit
MSLTDVDADLWLDKVVAWGPADAAAAVLAAVVLLVLCLLCVHVTQWKARTCRQTHSSSNAATKTTQWVALMWRLS